MLRKISSGTSVPITLAKPSHGPSKPIYHPRELRFIERWLNWSEDRNGHILEIGVSSGALGVVELLECVRDLTYDTTQLLCGQFHCHRFHDTISQLRNLGLNVKPRGHFFISLRCGSHYCIGWGFVLVGAFRRPSNE
jgi:hypothetical protein